MAQHAAEVRVYTTPELAFQASSALTWLRRLPVAIQEIDIDAATAPLPNAIHAVFVTQAMLGNRAEQLAVLFNPTTAGSVISIALEPLDNTEALLPKVLRREIIKVAGLTLEHQAVRCCQAILRALDLLLERNTSHEWDRGTELLPESLLLHCAHQTSTLPSDYGGLFTIGRGQTCQLQIDSTYASRLHGCFRVCDGAFTYRDMSSNGTRLLIGHDERIVHDEEVPLTRVGALRIGNVEINFSMTAA